MKTETTTKKNVKSQIKTFCGLFEPNDIVELRFIGGGPTKKYWSTAKTLCNKTDSMRELNAIGHGVYAGINPRKKSKLSGDKNVLLSRVICTDFDHIRDENGIEVKDDDEKIEIVVERINASSLPHPSLMLFSGHGVWCYWKLDKTISPGEFTRLQKKLAAKLKYADASVHNPERIVRLPGFWNNKKEPHKEAYIICSPMQQVSVNDIDAALDRLPDINGKTKTKTPEMDAIHERTEIEADDVETLMARAILYADKWEGVKEGEEGGRNTAAYKLGCILKTRFALMGEERMKVLRRWNKKNTPPLEEDELYESGVTNTDKYSQKGVGTELRPSKNNGLLSRYPWTDAGAGEMFAETRGGKFRFVVGWGWAYYDGMRWNRKRGEHEARRHFVKYVARKIRREALDVDARSRSGMEKFARELERTVNISNSLKEASCYPPILAYPADFDSDLRVLNCKNGTLNLKTGVLRQHNPADNLTQLADVVFDPEADCPQWDNFMNETFLQDQKMIECLYRWFGYCLTGQKTEHALPIFHGSGQNGKNVLLDTICGLMGDYAGEAAPDMLVQKSRNEHPTELADLFGKRLVVSSETEDSASMKIQLVKRLTGNRKIKARYMREDYFEWEATHKIVLVTNNLPTIKEDTHAIWRRLKRVPFKHQVVDEDVDPELTDKLIKERSGILNHLLRGCLSWQTDGLSWPEEVIEATDEYRDEQNIVKNFIDEKTELGEEKKCSVKAFREAFDEFCKDNGITDRISAQSFNSKVEKFGLYRKNATEDGRSHKMWHGVELLVCVENY